MKSLRCFTFTALLTLAALALPSFAMAAPIDTGPSYSQVQPSSDTAMDVSAVSVASQARQNEVVSVESNLLRTSAPTMQATVYKNASVKRKTYKLRC